MTERAKSSFSDAIQAAQLVERLGKLVRAADHAEGMAPAQWEALRYLGRANRFSRTPAALAAFGGTTRGTASQTLIALEAKGLIRKTVNETDARSMDLQLTSAGRALLDKADPIHDLAQDIEAAGDAAFIASKLAAALKCALARRSQQTFGQCHTCRHFRATVRTGRTPHHCALIDTPLSDGDSTLICGEHIAEASSD